MNCVTGSLNVNVNSTGPVAVPEVLSVITSVGCTTVLNACAPLAAEASALPARSVTPAPAGTDTEIVPATSEVGVTTSV